MRLCANMYVSKRVRKGVFSCTVVCICVCRKNVTRSASDDADSVAAATWRLIRTSLQIGSI